MPPGDEVDDLHRPQCYAQQGYTTFHLPDLLADAKQAAALQAFRQAFPPQVAQPLPGCRGAGFFPSIVKLSRQLKQKYALPTAAEYLVSQRQHLTSCRLLGAARVKDVAAEKGGDQEGYGPDACGRGPTFFQLLGADLTEIVAEGSAFDEEAGERTPATGEEELRTNYGADVRLGVFRSADGDEFLHVSYPCYERLGACAHSPFGVVHSHRIDLQINHKITHGVTIKKLRVIVKRPGPASRLSAEGKNFGAFQQSDESSGELWFVDPLLSVRDPATKSVRMGVFREQDMLAGRGSVGRGSGQIDGATPDTRKEAEGVFSQASTIGSGTRPPAFSVSPIRLPALHEVLKENVLDKDREFYIKFSHKMVYNSVNPVPLNKNEYLLILHQRLGHGGVEAWGSNKPKFGFDYVHFFYIMDAQFLLKKRSPPFRLPPGRNSDHCAVPPRGKPVPPLLPSSPGEAGGGGEEDDPSSSPGEAGGGGAGADPSSSPGEAGGGVHNDPSSSPGEAGGGGAGNDPSSSPGEAGGGGAGAKGSGGDAPEVPEIVQYMVRKAKSENDF